MPRGVYERKGPNSAEKRRIQYEQFNRILGEDAVQHRIKCTNAYYHIAIQQTQDFLQFLDERIEFYPEYQVEVIVFMNEYNQWRKDNKIKDSIHVIQRDIILRSFAVKKTPNFMYLGIRLKEDSKAA